MVPPRIPRFASALVLLTLAGGCAGDGNLVRDAVVSAGYGPRSIEAPEFVASSRRPGGDYLPVGVSAPPRPIRAKSAEGRRALEDELDGIRSRNEARGRAADEAGRTIGKGSAAPAE